MKSLFVKWNPLFSAPHRLFFLGGAIQGIVAMLWWLFDLSVRSGGFYPPISWTIPPPWAHAYLMIYGFFPFFNFGFLFTFFPNWLDAESVPFRAYLFSFITIASGSALFYAGLILGKKILFVAALLTLAGWGVGAVTLFSILLPTRSSEKSHLSLILLFLSAGGIGLLIWLLSLYTDNPGWLNLTRTIGIWFFIVPLIVTVSHLVIPFFSKAALKNYLVFQPMSVLWILLGGIFLRGLLEGLDLRGFFWIPDLVLFVLAFYLSRVWGFRKSAGIRILFMLHLSFAWFPMAILLDLLQSITFELSHETLFLLRFAPLHALTIGFFSSMVIGISTRVTLGHSGRMVTADDRSWKIFLIFQMAAVLRIMADFFPITSLFSLGGYEGSALLWSGGLLFWVMKYGPALWQPLAKD